MVTTGVAEGLVNGVDDTILLAAVHVRSPLLTYTALNVTALGSNVLVALFSAFALVMLLALRERRPAIQMLAAAIGATALTLLTKDIVERARPPLPDRLIAVTGYSYPSGHSVVTSALYLTIAIIASRHMEERRARIAIFVAASIAILMVGTSRVYLGVHYATDVLSGLSLGTAWALVLAAVIR